MLTGSDIREMFLKYFEQHGHKRVHSSSLVPANDPTLLFTNAGMNQFKDVFLGLEKRDYNRATTSQKCVRAGGKHNDLENVGFTARHHTFFEMLGNFSFGDYFKRDAVKFAWELVTSKDWYGIPKDRLYATIFKGEQGVPRDEEADGYWAEQGVPKDRILEMGMKDNFWQMGDTGPCGPCSELHYDLGPAASQEGHADCKFPCECGRYVEIWNLVFMQFDRDASGKLNPLPKPSIDTGAGLERIAAVMLNLQDRNKFSNYDTDLFQPLIKRAAELTGVKLDKELAAEEHKRGAASLRVIADHARATTFLISDGVVPANEGRGYVLRKIIRRAIRHGRLLGQDKPFLYQMVSAVRDLMKDAYPELLDSADRVAKVVEAEESRFAHTLDIGSEELDIAVAEAINDAIEEADMDVLEHWFEGFTNEERVIVDNDVKSEYLPYLLSGHTPEERENAARHLVGNNLAKDLLSYIPQAANVTLTGDEAFRLYETYGLPRDFIEDACRDAGIGFDAEGFDRAMEAERERAKASWKGAAKATASPAFRELKPTAFEGYRQTESDSCEVLAIIRKGQGVRELKPGDDGEVVLDHTPFYAESGGQVGDTGWFYNDEHNAVVAEVKGCYYPVQGVRAHKVVAKELIVVGQRVDAVVDTGVRQSTMRNHTGTHLLHAALREILGKHVKQAGSLVAPDHLRFDFSHFTSVADEELQDIEDLVNKEVLKNERVEVIEDVPIDVAVNQYKAMALFGEKYGDKVRVIKIGDFSTELCGGTHTLQTGEIGLVKVLREESVSSGTRRIEAVTGEGSLKHFRRDHELESVVSGLVRGHAESPAVALKTELERREEEIKKLRKELEQARMKSASAAVSSTEDKVKTVKGVKVYASRVENVDRTQMRTLVDNLRNKLGSGVVVLGAAQDGKVALIVGVTKDLTDRVQAGKIVGQIAQKVGGSGGGRPDMAEAGGKNPEALDAALADAPAVVESLLK
ncbi:MAG: alanine--tRNA ligase [Acidobacteriia bacterium]|nr:alanine--tRNA ligase [Terriglobia bacterium]